MNSIGFEVGDVVEWTSQAQGTTKTKRGTVFCVIDGFTDPLASRLAHPEFNWASAKECGNPRKHKSYLVAVATPKGKGKPRVYWPRVEMLRLVTNE